MNSSKQVSIKCPVCGARIADTTEKQMTHTRLSVGKICPEKAYQVKCHSCKKTINILLLTA